LDYIKESIQTHEYYSEKPINNKYYINSIEELDIFSSIYSNILDKYKDKLNDNYLFVYLSEESSGSYKLKLKDVLLEKNKVVFEIERNTPTIVTDDMAFWYLVALIPNKDLENINISDWVKPSDIKMNV
jgi:hypothetical protein